MPHGYGYNRKRLSRGKIVLILIGAALLYAGILLGVSQVGSSLEKSEAQEPVGSLDGRFDTEKLTLQYNGRTLTYRRQELTNLLLIGVDWMEESEASARYAGQADFLLLLTLDQRSRTVSALQLDRDTITDIRVFGPFGDYTGITQTQLCLSYAYGRTKAESAQSTVWSVSRLLGGIPIDGYLVMEMGGIAALNDALGGVSVTLEEDFSALDPQMTQGASLTLRGSQAEYFVRARMSVGDGTNVGRMRRQRAFIQAAAELFAQRVNEDMNYAGTVLDALSGYLTTDLERGWLINKTYACQKYTRPDMQTLAGKHSVGADGFTEFQVDADALAAMLAAAYFE